MFFACGVAIETAGYTNGKLICRFNYLDFQEEKICSGGEAEAVKYAAEFATDCDLKQARGIKAQARVEAQV